VPIVLPPESVDADGYRENLASKPSGRVALTTRSWPRGNPSREHGGESRDLEHFLSGGPRISGVSLARTAAAGFKPHRFDRGIPLVALR